MLREYCGYEGLILSFEPTPAVVTKLKQASQRDHLWHVFGIALGKENGLMPFRTMPPRFSVANSFRRIRNERLDAECHIVDVEVRRLADLLPELQAQYGFTRPFLKMDTQGFDLEVFQGAKQVWSSIVGLQSELTIESFYDDSPGWQESLEVYQGAGFALSAFVANNLDWFPRLREMDVLMFRPGASPGEVDGLASSS